MSNHQEMHSQEAISQEDGPCILHDSHSPITVVNELHHVFPVEFQMDRWGEVKVKTRVSICSTGHNTVHAAIRYFDKNGKWPSWCIGKTRELAAMAVNLRDQAKA